MAIKYKIHLTTKLSTWFYWHIALTVISGMLRDQHNYEEEEDDEEVWAIPSVCCLCGSDCLTLSVCFLSVWVWLPYTISLLAVCVGLTALHYQSACCLCGSDCLTLSVCVYFCWSLFIVFMAVLWFIRSSQYVSHSSFLSDHPPFSNLLCPENVFHKYYDL